MSRVNANHTPKRWGCDVDQGPCSGCEYRSHCAGQKDAVTGAALVATDSCDAFRAYGDLKRYDGLCRVPYRVRHSQVMMKHIERGEAWAAA